MCQLEFEFVHVEEHNEDLIIAERTDLESLGPDRVLRNAIGQLAGVVVVGTGTDGSVYYASDIWDTAQVAFMIDKFKHFLMEYGN